MTAFEKKLFCRGVLTAISGLHVGGVDHATGMTGVDYAVVRDPMTDQPYIPGSSLKGKLRSLLERARGEMSPGARGSQGGPAADEGSLSGKLFGTLNHAKGADPEKSSRARLVVRDARLMDTEKWLRLPGLELPYTEVKTEIGLDRLTGAAHPRTVERVPAGAQFELQFVITLRPGDDAQEVLGGLFAALALLNDDYIGGHGTRGYGQVKAVIHGVTARDAQDYLAGTAPRPFEAVIPEGLRA